MSNTGIGIDIDVDGIHVSLLNAKGSFTNHFFPYDRAIVANDESSALSIAKAMADIKKTVDLKNERVIVSLDPKFCFCRFGRLPPIEVKRIHDIMKFEAVQQIPYRLEETEWGYQTFKIANQDQLEYCIVAITKLKIHSLIELVKNSTGARVVGLIPRHFAIINDHTYKTKLPNSCYFLTRSLTTTDITVFFNGSVWSRTFSTPTSGSGMQTEVQRVFRYFGSTHPEFISETTLAIDLRLVGKFDPDEHKPLAAQGCALQCQNPDDILLTASLSVEPLLLQQIFGPKLSGTPIKLTTLVGNLLWLVTISIVAIFAIGSIIEIREIKAEAKSNIVNSPNYYLDQIVEGWDNLELTQQQAVLRYFEKVQK